MTLRITSLHIHHAVIPASDYDGKNGEECVDRIRKMHMSKTPPWSDIGYHFVAFWDGTWLPGRDINRAPASASGHNGKWMNHPAAICCFADFRTDDPLKGFPKAVAEIRGHMQSFSVRPLQMIPHRAMQSTWCPMDDNQFVMFSAMVEAHSLIGAVA